VKGSFFFVTEEYEFQEATEKGARILATLMELDTPSTNNRIYRLEEAKSICNSLTNKPIRYGANWLGKHLKNVPIIGMVETAWQEAKKIKGIVRIWDKGIIETLKKGTKYLFSVGGVADFGEVVQKGRQLFMKLWNAVCTHLQLLPESTPAGFPTAKMHEVIEINESCMIAECQHGNCPVLRQIKDDFEEALALDTAITKAINKAVAQDIVNVILAFGEQLVETES